MYAIHMMHEVVNRSSKEYFEIPSPEVVVETKGFGYIKKKELGGVVKAAIRGGYIKPEG